jgi:hypothetical protein
MAMYSGRVTGDTSIVPTWEQDGSVNMACGSLVDAMITKGYRPIASDKAVMPSSFYQHLKSSYDDGMKNAKLLCNKSGGWNAYALKAITAGERLLKDPMVATILATAIKQPRIRFKIEDGVYWEGDIDLLYAQNGTVHVIDLKSPSSTDDGWITSMGKNVKVPWYNAWSYWFQLSGYCYGVEFGEELALDGKPWSMYDLPGIVKGANDYPPHVESSILFGTREDVCEIGMIPLANMSTMWKSILTMKPQFGGPSKIEIIKAIVSGQADAPMCGKCDYCKSKSYVKMPDTISDMPIFDDIYGANDVQF